MAFGLKFNVDFYNPLNLFPSEEKFISYLKSTEITFIQLSNHSYLQLVNMFLHYSSYKGKKYLSILSKWRLEDNFKDILLQ